MNALPSRTAMIARAPATLRCILVIVAVILGPQWRLAAQEAGLFRGEGGALLPTPAELGADWEYLEKPHGDAKSQKVEYLLERNGASFFYVALTVHRSTEEVRRAWISRGAIAREHRYVMEPVPGLGEFGERKAGELMTYLHFARGNVYASVKWVGKGDGMEIAKAIDGKLLAALGGTPAARVQVPTYPAEKAQALFAEMIPIVEEVAGRKFKQSPTMRVVSALELRRALAADIRLQLTRDPTFRDDLEREIRAEASAAPRAGILLGKYAISEGTVLLPLENFLPALERHRLDPAKADEAMRRVLGHELTHALQDQYMGLAARLPTLGNEEARLSLNAAIEGHATFVEHALAERLGLTGQLSDPAVFDAPLDDDAVKTPRILHGLGLFKMIYEGGRQFFAYHHARGGNEKLWAILAAPPPRSVEIVQPDRYGEAATTTTTAKTLLEDFASDHRQRIWRGTPVREIGAAELTALIPGLTPDDAEAWRKSLIDAAMFETKSAQRLILIRFREDYDPAPLPALLDERDRERIRDGKVAEGVTLKALPPGELGFGKTPGKGLTTPLAGRGPDGRAVQLTTARVVTGRVFAAASLAGIVPVETWREVLRPLLERLAGTH